MCDGSHGEWLYQEASVIRTLLAHEGGLARGALAFVLGAEDDIEVVATIGRFEEVAQSIRTHTPRVTVLDADLVPIEDLPWLWSPERDHTDGEVLVLADTRRSHVLEPIMAERPARVGFVAKHGPPGRLVSAVRQVAGGETVLDPELVVSALQNDCPLTTREAQVLGVAAEGVPVAEIAQRLTLATGTVRNHLSRVLGKTGARTRIEAVRIAQKAGWI